MTLPAFPKLTSLVWPVLVALSLAGLLYMTITLKSENDQLAKDIKELQADIKKVKETNNTNTVIYVEQKAKDQQLVKDAGRKDLLFKKPGLIEIKINKSFEEYMRDFEK
ncbi:Rz-like spanin [Klebsiella phage iPHaGe-KPN-11i]|nr:Rz-like spanin [Klebsiella phage iPHaGe-KPN-12i]WOL25490.1 Rz-like spanin [Klebsiella phage iPHaGe-KPN-11i]